MKLSFPFPRILLVEAAVLILVITSCPSFASTDPSWSDQQPSWSNGQDDSAPQSPTPTTRRRRRLQDLNANLSPFAPGTHNLAVDIGQVFLMGNMGVNSATAQYSNSIGGQLHYTYGVSDLFGFDTSFGYSDHSSGQFSMTTLLAGLRTNLAWYDKVVPYLICGLGFYRPAYQFATAGGEETTVAPVLFGVHAGAGVDLAITKKLFFGTSLTLHDAFGATEQLPSGTPFSAGGMFISFLLHAGLTF